jgi:hypothetical protein
MQPFNLPSEPIILEYSQRRYDGGSEIDLIATIEARQEEVMSQWLELKSRHRRPLNRWQMLVNTLLMGPFELFVGSLGMLCGLFAGLAFKHFKHPALSQSANALFRECSGVFASGLRNTLLTPIRLFETSSVPSS